MNIALLKKGTRVSHTNKPEWGIGQLLEDANSEVLRVFFEKKGDVSLQSSFASKLKVLDGHASASMLLDNLHLPGPGQSRPMVTMAQAKLRLLELFPGGLHGDRMEREERHYKDELRRLALEWYKPMELNDLLRSAKYTEVVERAHRLIKYNGNNFPATFEKIAFNDGIKSSDRTRQFAEAFCAWVLPKLPERAAFESFARELGHISSAKWPIMTTYRFLLHPQSDVLIKPDNLRNAADVARFEINYSSDIKWLTYESVINFYDYIRQEIRDFDPRDNIDVQNFIWCIDPDQYAA